MKTETRDFPNWNEKKGAMRMTKSELERFQEILASRVADLEKITRQRDGITVERTADQVEEVQWASERALAVSNLDRDCSQLRNARAALGRTLDGSFGICQQCEEDIHPKRLSALPWAAYCIHCQEDVDRNPEEIVTPTRGLLALAA
jgi:DnaK suppressor protein